GGVPLAARLAGDKLFFSTLAQILPAWLAALCAVSGVGCLLYHAANDADLQIRRAYMWMGLAWLALGAALSVWPVHGSEGEWVYGTQFLPFGFFGFALGLLFLLSFIRNETDAHVRDLVSYLVGGLGYALALGGFLFGTVSRDFLLPYGI